MFTNEYLKRYQELLERCKDKGIVSTNETKPVCIPLNNKRRVKKESFMQKAKNDLLSEFSK